MKIIHIVAADSCGGIGKNNGLPWKIPGDLKHFAQRTAGKCLVMGPKTIESLPDSFKLGDRKLIQWDRDKGANSAIAEAIAMGFDELWVCGGAATYAAFPDPGEVWLTIVTGDFDCDVKYPDNPIEMINRYYLKMVSEEPEWSVCHLIKG